MCTTLNGLHHVDAYSLLLVSKNMRILDCSLILKNKLSKVVSRCERVISNKKSYEDSLKIGIAYSMVAPFWMIAFGLP